MGKVLCKDIFDSEYGKKDKELFDLELKYFSILKDLEIDRNKFFELVDSEELFNNEIYRDLRWKISKYDKVTFLLHLHTFLSPDPDDFK